ncbi:MAG: hypothetical protein FK730_03125 [Asgard group archaeon]|nr:hypothetical protein [Asgard group archaeon]
MSTIKQFDTLIKVGGSISEKDSFEQLRILGQTLNEIYLQHKDIIILGGGGIFAETIRQLQKEMHFSDETAHWMAIYGMEQYALILKEIIPQSHLIDVFQLEKQQKEMENLPILKISNFMKKTSNLEHTWNATSDAIACEVAFYLNLKKIIFVKDVDGIFVENKIVSEITVNQLIKLNSSPLDPLTPNLLKRMNLEAYVINGFHPKRIEDCLKGNKVQCTKIIS